MRDYYYIDPEAAAEVARALGLAAAGAMATILDITYCQCGLLPSDDDETVAALLGCPVSEWRELLPKLIAAEELIESGGYLLPSSKWARPEVDG